MGSNKMQYGLCGACAGVIAAIVAGFYGFNFLEISLIYLVVGCVAMILCAYIDTDWRGR